MELREKRPGTLRSVGCVWDLISLSQWDGKEGGTTGGYQAIVLASPSPAPPRGAALPPLRSPRTSLRWFDAQQRSRACGTGFSRVLAIRAIAFACGAGPRPRSCYDDRDSGPLHLGSLPPSGPLSHRTYVLWRDVFPPCLLSSGLVIPHGARPDLPRPSSIPLANHP